MPDPTKLNMALSRFEEAASYHRAMQVIELRDQDPRLTPDQQARRSVFNQLLIKMLTESMHECIMLGITEYQQSQEAP